MPKFIVSVLEVHVLKIEVEASGEQDAIWKVGEGLGNIVGEGSEYSHTLESAAWDVVKVRDSVLDWRPPADEA